MGIVGRADGVALGLVEGEVEGNAVGLVDGDAEGLLVGITVGSELGAGGRSKSQPIGVSGGAGPSRLQSGEAVRVGGEGAGGGGLRGGL